ncbi:MAG: cytochrome d ubiquinol oxidase subunit II [Planctomycetes bacterium]|nr:cytochrome d ubiquinol oxidase subunit II [Planctomycetota bacterium]
MIEHLWYWLLAAMLAMYVVLDGFDLGAGVASLLAARGDREKRLVLRAIGPVWDGNEVWLLAAGGVMVLAFPGLYAAAFSGFYLPLMLVLWLLILRGISIELRNHVDSPVWAASWDAVFGGASLLLCVVLGAALGNVVRGVPIEGDGRFFVPLWTDFGVTGYTGVLDPYTILVGLFALAALTVHGALWVAHKTEGDLQARARILAGRAWWGSAVLAVAATAATFPVQPLVARHLGERPFFWAFPAAAAAALGAVRAFLGRGRDGRAFLASALFLAFMLGTAVAGLWPTILPSTLDPARALTIEGTAGPERGLTMALAWWIPGILLVAGYFVHVYRRFAGKVSVEGDGY